MNAISQRDPAAIRPQNFMELERFANLAAKSNFVPKDYQGRPDNIMVAIQMGSELGLAPMQSLQNVSVINGRPSVWGDAMLALCRRSPLCEDVQEIMEGEGDTLTALCRVRRRGATPVTARFGVAEAKRANLWGKAGPWTQYPQRMLQLRARGFALRDAFPDLLRGLVSAEEATDTPTGPMIDGAAEPQQEAPKVRRKVEPTAEAPQPLADTGGNGDLPAPETWLEKYTSLLTHERSLGQFVTTFADACATASSQQDLVRLMGIDIVARALAKGSPEVKEQLTKASGNAFARLTPLQATMPLATTEPWDQETGEIPAGTSA